MAYIPSPANQAIATTLANNMADLAIPVTAMKDSIAAGNLAVATLVEGIVNGAAGVAYYQEIEADGIATTQRAIFNFSSSFTITDDPGNGRTNIDFAGGGGSVTSITAVSPLTGGVITTSGSIGIPQATSLVDGYLLHNDWVTFNSKGTVTSVDTTSRLTGGPITTTGTLDLAVSGITPGTFTSLTIDAYGRATGGTNPGFITQAYTTVQNSGSSVTQRSTLNVSPRLVASDVSSKTFLDFGTSGVSANTYQGLVVDAYGRVTSASDQNYIAGTMTANIIPYGTGAHTLAPTLEAIYGNRLYWDNGDNRGWLGIGCTGGGPNYPFDVTIDGQSADEVARFNNNNGSINTAIIIESAGAGKDAFIEYNAGGPETWTEGVFQPTFGANQFGIQETLAGPIRTRRFSMFPGGNVRIGSTTTDPGKLLQVDGTVNITGALTTSTTASFSGAVTITPTTNQITLGASAHKVIISSTAPAGASNTLTIPDTGGADTFAFLTKAQTLASKTLTAPIINGATSASGNFDLSGSSGTFLTCTGAATFGGSSNSFTNSVTIAATTNQLTLGASSHKVIVSSTAPAGASNTLTIPDTAGADTFVFTTFAQTLASKTLTAPIINGATSSGSTSIDLSGNSGTMKTTTGALTVGASGSTFTNLATFNSHIVLDGYTMNATSSVQGDALVYNGSSYVATNVVSSTLGSSLDSTGVNVTVSPNGTICHVTGIGSIQTINLPYIGFLGNIILIPDTAFTTVTGGNIALASTAVVNRILIMVWDGTSWFPSY